MPCSASNPQESGSVGKAKRRSHVSGNHHQTKSSPFLKPAETRTPFETSWERIQTTKLGVRRRSHARATYRHCAPFQAPASRCPSGCRCGRVLRPGAADLGPGTQGRGTSSPDLALFLGGPFLGAFDFHSPTKKDIFVAGVLIPAQTCEAEGQMVLSSFR